jgi:hypothetical protein
MLVAHLHIDTVATSTGRVHVASSVGVNSVRKSSGCVCEQLSVLQPLAVWCDVKAVDGSRVSEVVFVRESVLTSVRHVDVLEVRTGVNVSQLCHRGSGFRYSLPN